MPVAAQHYDVPAMLPATVHAYHIQDVIRMLINNVTSLRKLLNMPSYAPALNPPVFPMYIIILFSTLGIIPRRRFIYLRKFTLNWQKDDGYE